MKKTISKLLVLSSLFSLYTVSCSKPNSNVSSNEIGVTSEAEPEEIIPDLPDTIVDKSKLTYVSSLDQYKKTDWKAKWIWSDSSISNSYVAFRKSFSLNEVPSSAIASIAAENSYYLWINDELVIYDGGYKRGPTIYDTYYQDFDLTNYLKKGENTIVVLVSYWGRSGTSSTTAQEAGFLFEMKAGSTIIKSDSSWKVKRLREYKNKNLLKSDYPNYPQFSALAEWNLYYDARDSVGSYTTSSFDDSSWDNATYVANVGTEPFNDTYLCVAPPFAFDKEYTTVIGASEYLNKEFKEATTIKIDLGKNQQFSPYFELSSKNAGARITYYTDTYLTEGNGSFKDDYVAIEGKQNYESYPWRTGRYLIMEIPAGITLEKVAYRKNGYDTQVKGSFTSSDTSWNTLYERAVNTLTICMRDTYMDCPERERSPWVGDVANQIAQTLYCLDDNANLLTKKTILGFLGWTSADPNSEIPNCIPLRNPANKLTECPAQCLALLNSIFEYYLYTGDAETCKLFYPIALNYLKVWNMKNGLVEYRNGTFQWTDWGDGFVDSTIIQNCQYYMALKDTLAWAKDFAKTDDISFLEERINSIENAFDTSFLKEGGYTSSTSYDDRANAMAVVSGLAKEESYSKIKNVLATTYNCSVYMERYIEEALGIMGEFELMTTRTKSRYAPMLSSTYDTLWETFVINDDYSEGTPNHGWAGGPLIALSKYYLGVQPTKPGYETYDIKLSYSLDNMEGVIPTVQGNIEVKVNKNSKIEITSINDNGTLYLPKEYGENPKLTNCSLINETSTCYVIQLKKGSNTINL